MVADKDGRRIFDYIDRHLFSYWPVLVLVSDQGPSLFSLVMFLLIFCRMRLVYFPDFNHQDNNDNNHIAEMSGLLPDREKHISMQKFNLGPFKHHDGGGARFKTQQQAWDLIKAGIADPTTAEATLFNSFEPLIRKDLGLPAAGYQHRQTVIDHVGRLANKVGLGGSSSRWFSANDRGSRCPLVSV